MLNIFAQEEVWTNKSNYDEVECVNYEQLSKKQENNDIEIVAIDCEMVGIRRDGRGNMLARVSIVNSKGETIFDKFVKPITKVTDYRTPVSGIRPEDIEHGEIFAKVRKEVLRILKNKLVVGHSPEQDFKVLEISHPRHMIRDTATYSKFKELTKDQKPSLKLLTLHFLGASIQEGEHSSVQDAKAALQLYMLVRNDWELQSHLNNSAVIQKNKNNDIEVVAINCENVGVKHGNMLARVSIVNSKGKIIYDKFVKNTKKVTDYRTSLNGIHPKDIEHGEGVSKVKKEVAQILKNKLLVGHALERHFRVLNISHPEHMLRDTSKYPQFMKLTRGYPPRLKKLALQFLGASIQEGEHRSVQNAKTALQLYMLVRNDWELPSNLNNSAVIQKNKNNDIEVVAVNCENVGVKHGNMLVRNDKKLQSDLNNSAVIQKNKNNDIEVVAINCENVGGKHGNMLARVSIVNSKGKIIYDKFVKPTEEVTDYRTSSNGIQPKDIEHGEEISEVKKEVVQILKNKLLVGHAIERHFRVLDISHPEHMLRDTLSYPKFMKLKCYPPSLKQLAYYCFNTILQPGKHGSVQNAMTALRLYMRVRNKWESQLKEGKAILERYEDKP